MITFSFFFFSLLISNIPSIRLRRNPRGFRILTGPKKKQLKNVLDWGKKKNKKKTEEKEEKRKHSMRHAAVHVILLIIFGNGAPLMDLGFFFVFFMPSSEWLSTLSRSASFLTLNF